MPVTKKQWIVGGSLCALSVAGVLAAVIPQKPAMPELEAGIQNGVAQINQVFHDKNVPVALRLMAVEDVDSGHATARVRAMYVDLAEGVQPDSCMDLKTDLTFHSLLSTKAVSTVTTVVADPAQTDCLWIDELLADPGFKTYFQQKLNGQVPVVLEAAFDADGSTELRLATEQVRVTPEDVGKDVQVQFDPMELLIDVADSGDAYTYSMQWPGMALNEKLPGGQSVALSLSSLTASGDARRVGKNIWQGPGALSLDSVQFSDKAGHQFQLTGLKMTAEAQEAEGKLSQSVALRVDDLQQDGHSLGTLDYSVKMTDLDVEGLDRLASVLQAFERVKDPAEVEPLMTEFADAAAASFSGATLDLPMQYQLEDGQIQVDLSLQVGDLSGLDVFTVQANPAVLLSRLTGEINGQFNDALLQAVMAHPILSGKQAGKRPENLVQGVKQAEAMGVLVRDGSDYRTRLSWNGGELQLNDKPMDPALMNAFRKKH